MGIPAQKGLPSTMSTRHFGQSDLLWISVSVLHVNQSGVDIVVEAAACVPVRLFWMPLFVASGKTWQTGVSTNIHIYIYIYVHIGAFPL